MLTLTTAWLKPREKSSPLPTGTVACIRKMGNTTVDARPRECIAREKLGSNAGDLVSPARIKERNWSPPMDHTCDRLRTIILFETHEIRVQLLERAACDGSAAGSMQLLSESHRPPTCPARRPISLRGLMISPKVSKKNDLSKWLIAQPQALKQVHDLGTKLSRRTLHWTLSKMRATRARRILSGTMNPLRLRGSKNNLGACRGKRAEKNRDEQA